MSDTCQRRTLAATPTCAVHLCNCGVVQLELGPLTVRLDPEALRSVGATVDAAIAQLRALGHLPAGSETIAAVLARGEAH